MTAISVKHKMQQELTFSFTLETRSEYQTGSISLRHPHSGHEISPLPTALAFGDLNIPSRKSPLTKREPGSPVRLSCRLSGFLTQVGTVPWLSLLFRLEAIFPPRGQTNVTTQNVSDFNLFLGDI